MMTWRGIFWGLLVGILGAYLWDKYRAWAAGKVAAGDTGDVVAQVKRFFLTPVAGGPPGLAGTAGAAASDVPGGCGCH